jgi:hypothetical protein
MLRELGGTSHLGIRFFMGSYNMTFFEAGIPILFFIIFNIQFTEHL